MQHYFVLSTSPFPPTVIKIHHALLYMYYSDASCSVQIGFQPSDLAVSYTRSLQIQKSAFFFCDLSFTLDEVLIIRCRNATLRYDCSLGIILKM